MIGKQGQQIFKRVAVGDAAVDGLFAGLGAGLVMIVYLAAASALRGEGPAVLLTRFTASEQVTPGLGLLSHLSVSGIYGLLFGAAAALLLRGWSVIFSGWLAGLAYGALLFLVAELVILPGTGSLLRAIPTIHFAIAHLIYGLVLGSMIFHGQEHGRKQP